MERLFIGENESGGDGGGGGGGDGGGDGNGGDGGCGGGQSATAEELLKELINFAKLKSKSGMADTMICSRDAETARPECRDGSCPNCGFKRIWSRGVRKQASDEPPR